MPNPIYRYEGAEFLDNTPEAAAAVGAFVYCTGSRSIVVSQMVELYEQDTVEVPVANARALTAGDLLRVAGRDYPDFQLSVVSVNSARTVLTLQNYGAYILLEPDDELFVATPVSALYWDANLAHAYGDVLPRTGSAGRWEFYATESVLDFTVFGGGLSSERRRLARAGFLLSRGTSTIDVRNFESIQAAIDALPPEGGTVFIPAGLWTLTETLYTPCDRPCHLVGEGSNHEGDKGTVLVWTTNTSMLRLRGNDTSVRNMVLRNDSGGISSAEHLGAGIMVGRRNVVDAHPHPGTNSSQTEYEKGGFLPLRSVVLEDLVVKRAPGWGLSIPGHGHQSDGITEEEYASAPSGQNGGTLSFWVTVNRVKIIESKKFGGIFAGLGCTTIFFSEGAALAHGVGQASAPAYYAYIRGVTHASFHKWTFEGTSPEGDSTGTSRPWVKFVGCEAVVLDTVYFENDRHLTPQLPNEGAPYAPQYFVAFSQRNRAVSLRNVFFARHGVSGGKLRCIYCEKDGVKGLHIEQPCAMSSTALSELNPEGQWVPLDREAVVLNADAGGIYDNEHIVLAGAGVARDATQSDAGALEFPPLTHSNVPLHTHVLGTRGLIVPRSTPAQRSANVLDNQAMLAREGTIAVEALTTDEAGPHALIYSAGPDSGWRHIANVPTLTEDQRQEWPGWRQGDMVIDATVPKLLMFVEGSWQIVKAFPL
ncbi:MAG: hypothetical protein IT348_06690 [Candidatus Eisenbacteria bacterium]|nr:hypothetical protein [Candidatus Eisenbacteria bacterium]